MKKVLFSLAALFAFGFANAQDDTTSGGFKNGDAFISGTVSYDSQKTGDLKNTSFNVTPSVGFFVTDNIALGVAVGYTSTENDNAGSGFDTKQNAFTAGVFGRYYFNPASKFNIFGQLDLGYNSTKLETYSDFGPIEYKVDGFGVGLSPGMNYWLSNHFALEATFGILGYASAKPDFPGAESSNVFSIGLNLSDINFGLVYKF